LEECLPEKDTLAFKLNVNDTLRFSTVVNQKDTIKNVIIGRRKNASFSEEYKTRNKDRISVEIPNVSELANIMIAITDVGLRDSNMINLNNTYHADVVNWFLKFKKEPAIRFLDSIMNNTSNAGKYELYYTMKMYSTCYNMDTEGIFHRDSSILQMGYPKFFTAYDTHFASFQQFAQKSDFKLFYNLHKKYYDSLVNIYSDQIKLRSFKNWLEAQFPNKIDHFRITFSPLVRGAHSSIMFTDNNFTTSVIFVAPIINNVRRSTFINNISNSRVVFTEIDHDYSNPVSSKYEKQINDAFENRNNWADEGKTYFYPSLLSIFDEYMTWSLFTLYCYDHLPKEKLPQVMQLVGDFMENRRGFKKYKDFDKALLRLYIKEKKGKVVAELYPEIIKWCKDNGYTDK